MSKFLFNPFVALGILMSFQPAALGASLDYSKLQILNLDEMRERIDEKVNRAQAHMADEETKEAGELLRECLKTILSRPNGDNMVSQLLPPVRSKLKELGSFEETLLGLANEASYALAQGKEQPTQRATNYFVLENILSEFKPELDNNKTIKQIFENIRDANIQMPKEVINDLRLRGMYKPKGSPSAIAEKIIGKAPKD